MTCKDSRVPRERSPHECSGACLSLWALLSILMFTFNKPQLTFILENSNSFFLSWSYNDRLTWVKVPERFGNSGYCGWQECTSCPCPLHHWYFFCPFLNDLLFLFAFVFLPVWGMSGPLELELQTVVNYHVSAGNWSPVLLKSSTFTYWAMSPAPQLLTLSNKTSK